MALVVVTVLVIARTKLSPIWMVALGALVGALGWT
jgi:chromate transporter